jgi:hypothetical protein
MPKEEFKFQQNARVKVKGRKGDFQIEHPVLLKIPSISTNGQFSLEEARAYRLTDSTYAWEFDVKKGK